MARRAKKSTPEWVDRLLSFRKEISEDEYSKLWRRVNPLRKNRAAWNAEGQRIIKELEGEREQPVFRSSDFRTVRAARRAAEVYQTDNGGRIVRRDSSGRFSKRGKTFQVIGAKR